MIFGEVAEAVIGKLLHVVEVFLLAGNAVQIDRTRQRGASVVGIGRAYLVMERCVSPVAQAINGFIPDAAITADDEESGDNTTRTEGECLLPSVHGTGQPKGK